MGLQVGRVYSGTGHWTHKGNIMIDKEGYRWVYKLDVDIVGCTIDPQR